MVEAAGFRTVASALPEVLPAAEVVPALERCHSAGVSSARDDELDEFAVECGWCDDELEELVAGYGCRSTRMTRLSYRGVSAVRVRWSEPLWPDGFRTVASTRRRIAACWSAGSMRTSPLDDGCALSHDGGRLGSVLLELVLTIGLLLLAVVVLAACAGVNWGGAAFEVAAGAIPSSGGGAVSRSWSRPRQGTGSDASSWRIPQSPQYPGLAASSSRRRLAL